MSHDATNWAIKQRGLKPATKLVLWHLCDRHHIDHGCFPSQETLSKDCEMSRSSLNEHLNELETMGLIRREKRVDTESRRQKSTRYYFAFESPLTQDVVEPCPDIGHGAVSEKIPEPCPEKAESRVQNPDTNLVREPVREPSGARKRAGGGDFNILWNEWPDLSRPDNRAAAETEFSKLSSEDQIAALGQAREFRRLQALRGHKANMFPYLKKRLFAELVDAPSIDKDGDFVITPERPEWPAWLGAIREQHGEAGVQSVVRFQRVVRKTRWPEGHLQAAE